MQQIEEARAIVADIAGAVVAQIVIERGQSLGQVAIALAIDNF